MLVTIKIIAADQSKITQVTDKKVLQLLNYAAIHPTEIIRYHAREIILHMHSNAPFFLELGSKSRSGGYNYLRAPSTPPPPPPPYRHHTLNGTINVELTTMDNVQEIAMES